MVFNLEAIRYTLYSGEPILTGIMRLWPGPRFWGSAYIAAGVAQLATPALALGCANVVFTAAQGNLPDAAGADRRTLLWISYGILALTVTLLLSGKSIERLLERLSWVMIVLIFGFLLFANVWFVPTEIWISTARGFFTPRLLPAGMNWAMLGVFAATAGSGGLGNLAISNWSRDKGFGMGRWMGAIGGVFAADHMEAAEVGRVFPPNSENLRRWAIWWKYTLLDQSVLWALGCVAGMFLNVNLTLAIVPANAIPANNAVGAFQAKYMADAFWHGFWILALCNGFWILFSTQLGNTDCLTRVVADTARAGWPALRRTASSRLYAACLTIFMVWGIVTLAAGDNALQLFQILGLVASPILAVGAFQILRVNTRFLPVAIQPPFWRRASLLLCGLCYTAVSLAAFGSLIRDLITGSPAR